MFRQSQLNQLRCDTLRHVPVTFNGYEVNEAIVLLYSLRTGDWRNG